MFDNQCFLCSDTTVDLKNDKPYMWLQPRILCSKHPITLLTGERMDHFASRYDGMFGDSGWSEVLNPVYTGTTRCWIHFCAGGYTISEEIFTSENYFEYCLQHLNGSGYIDKMYALCHSYQAEQYNSLDEWFYGMLINADKKNLAKLKVSLPSIVDMVRHVTTRHVQCELLQEEMDHHGLRFLSSPEMAMHTLRNIWSKANTQEDDLATQKCFKEIIRLA